MDPLKKSKLDDRSKAKPDAPAENKTDAGNPDVRLKKIAKIKKALEDGTYRVSNEEVARKLIEHMLEPKE
jgi:flagellar biosynthesis anti-sigma factor FlgM